MKPISTLRNFLSLAGSSLLAISSASGQSTLYYDGGTVDIAGNGNTAASGLTGNWNTALLNWDAGAVPYVGWNNSNNDIAFFHRGTAIPGPNPGVVSLTSDITVGGLIFNASGYNITTGANALTFGATNNTVALNNRVTAATITGTIGTSAANMTFTAQNPGGSTITFTGANTTGWSGTTTVNGGMTLSVDGATGNRALGFTSSITLNGGSIITGGGVTTANSAVDFFNDSAAITVNGGGSITYGPINAGPTFIENIGAVTVNSGEMRFATGSISSGTATLVIPSITRSTSTSNLIFSLRNNGALVDGNSNRIQVTGSGTTAGWTSGDNSNSIIGAWATSGLGAGADYAVYSGNNVVSANTIASAETNWIDTSKQYTLTNASGVGASAVSGRLGATRNVTALRNTTAATATTSVDATTETYTLTGHGFLNGDVVSATGTGGLTVGLPYYIINVIGDTFQLSTTSGGGAVNLTNTTAGQIAGGVTLSAGNNLGTTGILNANATTLAIGGSGGVVTLPTTTSGNLFVNATAGAIAIDAPITNNGAGVLTLVKGGAQALLLSGNNTYTGGTVVNAGAVTLTGTNTFATGAAGADVINGGSLTYSTLNSWGGTGRDVTFNGTGTLTSTVGGYSGGTLTTNAGANAIITNASSGTGGLTFATTTGAGNLIYSVGANRLLNLGNASGFTGTLQARLTGNANLGTNTTIQFSAIGDAVGSAIQFAGGTGDGNQAITVAYNGSAPLVFDNRQIQILDRLTGNWENRYNTIANNSANAANTWTINTDLLYTGGSAITAFGGSLQTGRSLRLSGTNTGDNAFNGVISNGQNTNGLLVEKDGSGKWILGGANTYTGTTTVSAGILEIGGSGTLGNVSAGVGSYAGNISIASTSSGRLVYNSTATQTLGGVISGAGAVFVEDGTLTLSNASNSYTGTTTVNDGGTLLINGITSSTSVVTVNVGGAIGGTGSIGSTLSLIGGSFHVLDLLDALQVTGTVSIYAGFGVDDLVGLTWGSVDAGTYTLINGTLGVGVFDALSHNTPGTAFDVGFGKTAYFQEGSLQLVVIPEPSAALLGGLGVLLLLRRRR